MKGGFGPVVFELQKQALFAPSLADCRFTLDVWRRRGHGDGARSYCPTQSEVF